MRLVYNILLLGLVLIGLSFASLNSQVVHFNYYFGEFDLQLSLLLVLVLGAGIMVGVLASFASWVGLKHENFKLKMQLRSAFKDADKKMEYSLNKL